MISWPKFSFTSYCMVLGLIRQGITPRTVIDVGANVGQFAISAAKLLPGAQIYSFEPHPGCVSRLRKNTRALKNVVVFPVALGNASGKLPFFQNVNSHSSSLLPLAGSHKEAFPGAVESGTIEVAVATLDEIARDLRLEAPVLLKLDVQGYESQVLEGAAETLARVDHVLLEASFKPLYVGEKLFPEIMKQMEERGFGLLRPVGWLADPRTDEIIQMDALFSNQSIK